MWLESGGEGLTMPAACSECQDEYKHLLRGSRLELFPPQTIVLLREREEKKMKRLLIVAAFTAACDLFPSQKGYLTFYGNLCGTDGLSSADFLGVNGFLNWKRIVQQNQLMEKCLRLL